MESPNEGISNEHKANSPFTHPVGHREEKVWGSWEILAQGDGYQIKRLVFKPGAEMSMQTHKYRAEHWTVISGTGAALIGGHLTPLLPAASRIVGAGEEHHIRNYEEIPLIILEIQYGSYLGDDDLIRISDANGRTLGEVDPSNDSGER